MVVSAAVTLLDLSVALDTVDNATLIRCLELSYGICGQALSWRSLYLSDPPGLSAFGKTCSRQTLLRFGVLHGSVLGPIFSSFTQQTSLAQKNIPDECYTVNQAL